MTATLLLQNGTIIDGTGRPPQDQAILVIRDRHIAFVGERAAWQPEANEEVTTLDMTGRFILPGLIDCHVHLAMGRMKMRV